MIRLNKKLLLGIFLFLLVVVFGGGGYFLFSKASKYWNDSTTWSTDGKVALPVQATSNYKITSEDKDGKFTIEIPFCVLYDVAVVSDKKLEYYCAAIPYSSIELTKRFPDKIKLNKDIVISYNEDQDQLPTSFLGYITIDKEAISSIGSDPRPVSISMIVDYEKPAKNPISLINHYLRVTSGKKDSYIGLKVSDWKVDVVKQASEYSDAEKKEIIKEWRAAAWKDINTLMKTSDYLDMPNSKDLMVNTAKWMVFRNLFCPTAQTQATCQLGYEENASSNLVYFTYAANKLEKKRFDRIAGAMRERIIPFVLESNPELVEYYLQCDTATECNYFHRLELYDYPACPILELGKVGPSDVKQLFIDFRSPTLGDEYDKMDFSQAGMLKKLGELKLDFEGSKNLRRFTYAGIQDFDRLCYKVLKDNVTDAVVLKEIHDLYMYSYLARITIDEGQYKGVTDKDALFDLVLQSSKLNPFNYTTVPFPLLTYQRLLTGVQKEDNSTAADGYWSSLNATMILLYLTSNY